MRLAPEFQPNATVLDDSKLGLGSPKVAELLRQASPRINDLTHTVHEDSAIFGRRSELGINGCSKAGAGGTN